MEHTYCIHVKARGSEALCDRQVRAAVDRLERTEPGFVAKAEVHSLSRLDRALEEVRAGAWRVLSTAERIARYDGS